MRSLRTEIEINASPERVWNILMDFEKYGEWNPFIQSIEGDAQKGGKLKAVLHQPDSKPMTIKPNCLVAEQGKEFRWLGHMGIPGIFDGEHIFQIEDLGENKVKFIQSENFKGILVGALWKMLDTKTRKGFEMMNEGLKRRAES